MGGRTTLLGHAAVLLNSPGDEPVQSADEPTSNIICTGQICGGELGECIP